MAIRVFEEQESNLVSKPFVNEWVEGNKKDVGRPYSIESVILSKKGTGYLVTTSEFLAFYWKKSSIATQLIEALEYYSEVGEGPRLVAIPQKDGTCKIGVDEDNSFFYSRKPKGFCISHNPIPEEEISSSPNPLLVKRHPSAPPLTSSSTPKKRTSSQEPL